MRPTRTTKYLKKVIIRNLMIQYLNKRFVMINGSGESIYEIASSEKSIIPMRVRNGKAKASSVRPVSTI
jgi:phosphatidate phosphatase APP1